MLIFISVTAIYRQSGRWDSRNNIAKQPRDRRDNIRQYRFNGPQESVFNCSPFILEDSEFTDRRSPLEPLQLSEQRH